MLIPEPSTAESVAVAAAATTFATVLEANAFYELVSTTNCWIARARELTFADRTFTTVAEAITNLLTATAHGLQDGDGPFRLTTTGVLPGGLAAATDYWVVVEDADRFYLATSLANALAATVIDVTDDGTGVHTIVDTATTAHNTSLVFADETFTADDTTDLVEVVGHGLVDVAGPFRLTNDGGALPAGLAAATDYWAIVEDEDHFYLASSLANAYAGTEIDITDAGTGTHTIIDQAGTLSHERFVFPDDTFTALSVAGSDLVTMATHGLTTGDGPFRVSNEGGALPTGLAAGTDYWVIVNDANTFWFATTLANALAGTKVAITGAGTGTHTMSDTTATIHVGGAAVALASGAMLVPAGVPRQIPGAFTVSGNLHEKLSIIRASADGSASLTKLAEV